MNTGYKISGGEVDILSATEKDRLVSSGTENANISKEQRIDYTWVSNPAVGTETTIATVAHNLGYVPELMAMINHNGPGYISSGGVPVWSFGRMLVLYATNIGLGTYLLKEIYWEADTVNAYLRLHTEGDATLNAQSNLSMVGGDTHSKISILRNIP